MRISAAGTASFTGNALASAGDAATITIKQSSTVATNGIYLERGGEQKGYYIYMGGAVDSLTFQRNNAGTKGDVMSLTRDGNVGIGTATPVTLNGADANLTIFAGQDCSLTLKDSVENWELYVNDDLHITTGSYSSSFTLNSNETITSDFVFCRARNAEFNYTENPSFISGSTGAVLYDLFVNSPTTYITTVGMYNDSNELLAVAKLSKPLKKDFTKEALIRVKLDF
jgi:hypothetical protein